MNTRKGIRCFKRIKGGFWLDRGQWTPTYAYDQQHNDGAEYQHYAFDAKGKCVYAGVTRHERMNQATANQIHRVWLRWRREYVVLDHGDPVAFLVMFPIDSPDKQERFDVAR